MRPCAVPLTLPQSHGETPLDRPAPGYRRGLPSAFEAILGRIGALRYGGETHELAAARIRNEPFDLRSKPRYTLVIDRLSWWYDLPREWLKKIALLDDVYLLNRSRSRRGRSTLHTAR
jgi:hypothetical protein